jgi:hypothetical protein
MDVAIKVLFSLGLLCLLSGIITEEEKWFTLSKLFSLLLLLLISIYCIFA